MNRKPWTELVAEIDAMCKEVGIEWHELRNEIGRFECESGNWPEDEGMGTSDMNCMTVERWGYDPEGLRAIAREIAAREALRRDLELAGVDMDAMRRLFAPA